MAIKLRLSVYCLRLTLLSWILLVTLVQGDNKDYDFDDFTDVQPIQTNATLETKQSEKKNQSSEQPGVTPTSKIQRLILISVFVNSKSNQTNSGHIGRSTNRTLFHQSRLLRKKRSNDRYRSTDADDQSDVKSSRHLIRDSGGRGFDIGSDTDVTSTNDLGNGKFNPYERFFLTSDQRAALLDHGFDTLRSSSSKTKTEGGNYRDEFIGSDHDYHSDYRYNNPDEDRYRYKNDGADKTDRFNGDYSRNGYERSYDTNNRHEYGIDKYRTESSHNLYYNRGSIRSSYSNDNGRNSYNEKNYGNDRSRSNDHYSNHNDYYSKNYNRGGHRYKDSYHRNDRSYEYSVFGRDSNSNDNHNQGKSRNEYTSYNDYNRRDTYKDNSYDKNKDRKYDRSGYDDNRYGNDRSRYFNRFSTDSSKNHYTDYTDNDNDYRRNSHNGQGVENRYSSRNDDRYYDGRTSKSYDKNYNIDHDRVKAGRRNYGRHKQTGIDSYQRDYYGDRHEQKPAYPDTLYNDLSLPSKDRLFQDYSLSDHRSSSIGSEQRETSRYSDKQNSGRNNGYDKDDYFYGDNARSQSDNTRKGRSFERSYKHKLVTRRRYHNATLSNHTEQDMALNDTKTRLKRQAPEPRASGYQYNTGYYNQESPSTQFQNSFQYGRSDSHQRQSYPSPSAEGRYAPSLTPRSYSDQHLQPDYPNNHNAYRTYQQPYQNHYDQRPYYDKFSFDHQNSYERAEYANYDTSGYERSLSPYSTPSAYQQTPHHSYPYHADPKVSGHSPHYNSEYKPYPQPSSSFGNNAGSHGGYGRFNGNFPHQGQTYAPFEPHQQGQEYSPYYDNSQQGLYNSHERESYSHYPYDQGQGSGYGTFDQRQVGSDLYSSNGRADDYTRPSYKPHQGYQGRQNFEYTPYNYAG